MPCPASVGQRARVDARHFDRGLMMRPSSCAMIEPLEARRLLSTGDLDPTFGTRGKVVIDQSYYPDIEVTDAALQRDGKIIEVGELDLWGLAVVRLNTDGTVDPTFTPPTKASDRRLA